MTKYTDGQIEELVRKWRRISDNDNRDGIHFAANRVLACVEDLEHLLADRQAAKAGVVTELFVKCSRCHGTGQQPNGTTGRGPDDETWMEDCGLCGCAGFVPAALASVWPTAGGDSTTADELEDCKKAYALLFAENAKIRSMADVILGLVNALQDAINNPNDDAYWIKQATDAIAAAEGEKK